MKEEITAPLFFEPKEAPKKHRKHRSLLLAIGLPLITLLIVWLTTNRPPPPPPPPVEEAKPQAPTLDPATLPEEQRAFVTGELTEAEMIFLRKFQREPFSEEGKKAGILAKKIHQIIDLAGTFPEDFLEGRYEEGIRKFNQLQILDQEIRSQFQLPFLGQWAEQIRGWEEEIRHQAELIYYEGYALLRSAPKEAMEKYQLAIRIAGDDSEIGKKAQKALQGLGLRGS